MQAPEATDPALRRRILGVVALARTGRVTDALATIDALRDDAAVEPGSTDATLLLATGLDCRLARGDVGAALALGDELTAYLDAPGQAGALAHHAHGELGSVLNEVEPALAHFETAGRLVADRPEDPELLPWRAGAALADLRLGRRTEAAALARRHLEVALESGSPYATAQALRTLATTDASGDRIGLLRKARATLAGTPAARLAAQIDTDLAGVLLLPGRRVAEALELLRAAEEYAGCQELWPLQSRVRRLLERVGEGPRRVQGEVLAALTAAEQRVARLAADGLTNRQIAEELVVTVKAVEWHLSHVYRKLGISSRTRLPGVLGSAR